MTVHLVSNQKIAETSSKGNQEKWLDCGIWYKLDQFGYEALAEVFTSQLLEYGNIEAAFPFTLENLYRKQLEIPSFTREQLAQMVKPLFEYYPTRDRELIADRVCKTILLRQKCR